MRFAFRLAVGTMIFGTACISLRPSVVDIAETDAELVASGAGPIPVVETYTTSLALDRIAKRRPALDGVARRMGTGRGVSIYVFDGGVSTIHPELKGRVRAGYDAYPSNPRICNAHGTAVAGAAAGRTLGVAPDAEVVDIKIINCLTKHGSAKAILAAARWVVADHLRRRDRPAVANWSFVVAPSDAMETVTEAIEVLEKAGILVVSAAGNVDTDACGMSLASSGSTLVVGASALVHNDSVSFRDVRVAGTAWGRCVDVYAPGDSVLLPNLVGGAPTAALWSGTSMATGYVSGAAALVLEAMPSATPAQLTRIIERRATNDVVDSRVRGRGVKRGRLLYIGPALQLRSTRAGALAGSAGWFVSVHPDRVLRLLTRTSPLRPTARRTAAGSTYPISPASWPMEKRVTKPSRERRLSLFGSWPIAWNMPRRARISSASRSALRSAARSWPIGRPHALAVCSPPCSGLAASLEMRIAVSSPER